MMDAKLSCQSIQLTGAGKVATAFDAGSVSRAHSANEWALSQKILRIVGWLPRVTCRFLTVSFSVKKKKKIDGKDRGWGRTPIVP